MLTNDIKFTTLWPSLAIDGPVSGPDTAAVGHGIKVSDEETAVVGLLGGQTNAAISFALSKTYAQ